jgi:uncharacterized membrane protein YccF (DUF307 family)
MLYNREQILWLVFGLLYLSLISELFYLILVVVVCTIHATTTINMYQRMSNVYYGTRTCSVLHHRNDYYHYAHTTR